MILLQITVPIMALRVFYRIGGVFYYISSVVDEQSSVR